MMNYITKWNYFMSLAMLTSKRSKDPSTQVGACIVNQKRRVIGLGYNGFPNGCRDGFSWNREGDFVNTKYAYVVHAELNAIMNSTSDLENSTIFCTLFPCNECAKAIVQAGIKRVVYWSDKFHDSDFSRAARAIFGCVGIETVNMEKCILYGDLEFNADTNYWVQDDK
jgi:dCMP deaminase